MSFGRTPPPDPERTHETLRANYHANPGWPVWPEQWRRGVSQQIATPAPGAWTAPEGLGFVQNNLGSMFKWLENRALAARQRGGLVSPEEQAALGL